MFNCKYCNKECKNKNSLAQHEIRCKENPEHIIVHSNLGEYLKPGHAHENQYTKAAKLGLPKPIVSEETRKKLSDKHSWKLMSNEQKAEVKEKISKTCSEKAKSGKWHKSVAKNMHYKYNDIDLDGSWEYKYAIWLDKNNIKWIRPTIRFEYHLDNKIHYYTPDFYLLETDEYIEVKGYKTAKDDAKWAEFPADKKLKILFKKDLKELGII